MPENVGVKVPERNQECQSVKTLYNFLTAPLMEVRQEISVKCQLLLRELEARFGKVSYGIYGECQGSGREGRSRECPQR